MVLFPPPFYFVFYISNFLSYIKNNFSYELARHIMGTIFLVYIYIREYGSTLREYGSTLYVGLSRAVSPTNTNFGLTFLLTRLQEALYEDLAV